MQIEPWAWAEMAGAQVPDLRRRKSLALILQKLFIHSERSFSAACGADGRQAARRIFTLPKVAEEQLLQGHFTQTASRCEGLPLVLVVQDTTTLEYHTHLAADGLGPINDSPKARGFFAHTALAMTESGVPLGLVSARFWTREVSELGKTAARRKRVPDDKESRKWREALEDTERVMRAQQRVLLIQDREADVFAFLSAPRRPCWCVPVRRAGSRCPIPKEV